MKMAAPAQGWLLPSLKGLLLLCTLALLLCIQHPGATAEGNVATNNSLVATRTTSLATRTTPVATRTTPVTASTISGVATKTSSAPARTTKLATRTTPVATHTTKLATSTTPVATHTTKLATSTTPVATHTTKLATRTTPVATHTTTRATSTTSVATNPASVTASTVSVVATKTSSVATPITSQATNTTSVATSPASVTASTSLVVATNSSGKSEEETQLTCQSFQCSGERCYQDESHANSTVTCATRSHCQLYRFSSTNYSAGCSSTCSLELCRANSSVSTQHCTLDCCSSSLCLQLNASSYGDLPATTTLPATTSTTTRAPPRNVGIIQAGPELPPEPLLCLGARVQPASGKGINP
ncbi:uncharacterized protein [Heliangelus exortis]|uniref:uncharacterized protein n=1 Tax=Heliangelus exortis TaxID=472823 RepID=UPI003A8DE6EB